MDVEPLPTRSLWLGSLQVSGTTRSEAALPSGSAEVELQTDGGGESLKSTQPRHFVSATARTLGCPPDGGRRHGGSLAARPLLAATPLALSAAKITSFFLLVNTVN